MEATALKESIADAVKEYATQKQQERVKSLSRMNPEKVGLILYLFCLGIGIALVTRLPFVSALRLLIPMADRKSQGARSA